MLSSLWKLIFSGERIQIKNIFLPAFSYLTVCTSQMVLVKIKKQNKTKHSDRKESPECSEGSSKAWRWCSLVGKQRHQRRGNPRHSSLNIKSLYYNRWSRQLVLICKIMFALSSYLTRWLQSSYLRRIFVLIVTPWWRLRALKLFFFILFVCLWCGQTLWNRHSKSLAKIDWQ